MTFVMLAGSQLTLANIAIGILLPKWMTFLHIFIFIFAASVVYVCFYLYGFPAGMLLHRIAVMLVPGSGKLSVFLHQSLIFDCGSISLFGVETAFLFDICSAQEPTM